MFKTLLWGHARGALGLLIASCALLACGEEAMLGMNDCRAEGAGCPRGQMCLLSESDGYTCVPEADMPGGERDAGAAIPTIDGDEDEDPNYVVPGAPMDEDDNEMPSGGAMSPPPPAPPEMEEESACGSVRLLLKPSRSSIPRVVLVVDRSYSMNQHEDRWSPVVNTLRAVTNALSDSVHFGLVLFPFPLPINSPPDALACAPGAMNVEPAANTAAEIGRWLTDSTPHPGLATPTFSALGAAGDYLAQNPTGNDYVILATDGGPGCNYGLDVFECTCLNHACLAGIPEMCLDDVRTVNKVEELARQGIKTIVLGITGQDFQAESRRVLNAMAVAGERDNAGSAFDAGNVNEIEGVLSAAAGSLAPCEYDMDALAEYADQLVISIDEQVIPRDDNNGWGVNGNIIQFHGDACAALRDGGAHQIDARCE